MGFITALAEESFTFVASMFVDSGLAKALRRRLPFGKRTREQSSEQQREGMSD